MAELIDEKEKLYFSTQLEYLASYSFTAAQTLDILLTGLK
jgi:hypothetical protein